MRLFIEQRHIDQGQAALGLSRSCSCPIALALSEMTGTPMLVGGLEAIALGDSFGSDFGYQLDSWGREFAHAADNERTDHVTGMSKPVPFGTSRLRPRVIDLIPHTKPVVEEP